jgi:hypothetical protein
LKKINLIWQVFILWLVAVALPIIPPKHNPGHINKTHAVVAIIASGNP